MAVKYLYLCQERVAFHFSLLEQILMVRRLQVRIFQQCSTSVIPEQTEHLAHLILNYHSNLIISAVKR